MKPKYFKLDVRDLTEDEQIALIKELFNFSHDKLPSNKNIKLSILK